MTKINRYPKLSAEEAAAQIPNGATVAFSGFSTAGAAKAVPRAIARRAREIHGKGQAYQIGVLTGGSTGKSIDEELAASEAISWRAPYQSSPILRNQINEGKVEYMDMHLSHVPQMIANGFFGKLDFAVIEATEITPDGRVFLTTSIGASPAFLKYAERVIIEINSYQSIRLREIADIAIMPPLSHQRSSIPIFNPLSRIGHSYAAIDPRKIVGIVENHEPDLVAPFGPRSTFSKKIADHIARFLLEEMKAGRLPKELLPFEAGIGDIGNGVISTLGGNDEIPPFKMYTEVLLDSLVPLMEKDRVLGVSATALTVAPESLKTINDNMDFFVSKIVLRSQEFSNHPGIIRRLGVIAMNTALEVDLYGNTNSTHICGTDLMNGIGGSMDFSRNSYISFIMCPSISKGGKISNIVPMCSHVDNTEHSVSIIVTDQGLADMRRMGPAERSRTIIEKCAHPSYRPYLRRYLETSRKGHLRHNLENCFELHRNLRRYGAMLPDLKISEETETAIA
jgi:propionyl-CoA:succinyl-CoA transferase